MVFTAVEIARFGAAEGRKHEDGTKNQSGEFFVPLRQLVVLLGALKAAIKLELERDFKSSRPQRQTRTAHDAQQSPNSGPGWSLGCCRRDGDRPHSVGLRRADGWSTCASSQWQLQ